MPTPLPIGSAMSRRVAPPDAELVLQAEEVPQVAPANLQPFMEAIRVHDGRIVGWRIRQDRLLGHTMVRKVAQAARSWRSTFEVTRPLGQFSRVVQLGEVAGQLVGSQSPLCALTDPLAALWDGEGALTMRFATDEARAALRSALPGEAGVGWAARNRHTRALDLSLLVAAGPPVMLLESDTVSVVAYADTGLSISEWAGTAEAGPVVHVESVTGWSPVPNDEYGRLQVTDTSGGSHALGETASDHFMSLCPLTPSAEVVQVQPIQVFSHLLATFDEAADWVVERDGTMRVRQLPGRLLQ